jgi:ATP-dependent Clp protease adapter protein ClpS
MPKTRTQESTRIEGVNMESLTARYAVEAHNNDVSTFDQVMDVFMKHCGYDQDTALMYTFKIHNTGKAVCYWAEKEACERVIRAFAEIGVEAKLLEL